MKFIRHAKYLIESKNVFCSCRFFTNYNFEKLECAKHKENLIKHHYLENNINQFGLLGNEAMLNFKFELTKFLAEEFSIKGVQNKEVKNIK